MKTLSGIFTCCCIGLFFSGVLCCPSSSDERSSRPSLVPEGEASGPLPMLLFSPDVENGNAVLPPLFKVLTGHSHQEGNDGASRPRPDSRALSYMKRLYKMFATKEGIPKANKSHLYNTVRLFTPRAECKHPTEGQVRGDLRSVDLLFNLDCVTALERLFKSVLLYSLNKSVSKSSAIICTCNLVIKEHDSSNDVCSSVPHTMTVELRRRWVEIDVTTFLQPLMASNKRSIHVAVNFTCLKDNKPLESKWNLETPSLLLYLNDTSEQAYHRRDLNPVWSGLKNTPFTGHSYETGTVAAQTERASRHRRDDEGKVERTPVPLYNLSHFYQQFLFPQNECELQNYWLKFSQLKWDQWIIAPHRYNPRYCKGECPRVVGHRYGSPVHTMVQNIIYEKLDSSVPRPSCIPAEYSPLSVLKLESDRSIAYKEYENMIATKCTCR
ncbi:growth/differentiation factor 9 [Eublepharis macularius]|uniref:Growth/differentiation factor 9 n=1 Tax=Eublepharis macularius TaxID=481883 RepID=A0AA97JCA3_EUBMA|nr:growth/differentiation factor 9 [Eublepharis macularius]